jgi:hypothetical protein
MTLRDGLSIIYHSLQTFLNISSTLHWSNKILAERVTQTLRRGHLCYQDIRLRVIFFLRTCTLITRSVILSNYLFLFLNLDAFVNFCWLEMFKRASVNQRAKSYCS